MKYLTYLDYSELDYRDASIEGKLSEKDKEIQLLKEQMQQMLQEQKRMSTVPRCN